MQSSLDHPDRAKAHDTAADTGFVNARTYFINILIRLGRFLYDGALTRRHEHHTLSP